MFNYFEEGDLVKLSRSWSIQGINENDTAVFLKYMGKQETWEKVKVFWYRTATIMYVSISAIEKVGD